MEPVRSPVYPILNHPAGGPLDAWRLGDAAIEGGAGLLQFRSKQRLSEAELSALKALARRSAAAGVPLLINDFVELALAVGAAGVHVGQSDEGIAAACRMLGPDAIIGATTPTVALAQQAELDGASYVAVGAMYPSPTKPEKPVLGPARLRAVAEAVAVPVCAIGGITAVHVPELLAAGADLLAVISTFSAALDPAEAIRELVAACNEALR
jgi:thiamine-phosphate pyrophosphorylase